MNPLGAKFYKKWPQLPVPFSNYPDETGWNGPFTDNTQRSLPQESMVKAEVSSVSTKQITTIKYKYYANSKVVIATFRLTDSQSDSPA